MVSGNKLTLRLLFFFITGVRPSIKVQLLLNSQHIFWDNVGFLVTVYLLKLRSPFKGPLAHNETLSLCGCGLTNLKTLEINACL
jgi:hypothetical protein